MKKVIRSKKAQFYIFAAVLLSVIAFTMAKPRETPLQKDDTFRELYQNYIKEAARATDNALLNSIGLKARFEDFNNNFKTYSNSKNIKFGFVGIAADDNETIVHNKMDYEVGLSYLTVSETLSRGEIRTINWSDQVFIELNDVNYGFNFTDGIAQVKGLFFAKSSGYEKVYAYN